MTARTAPSDDPQEVGRSGAGAPSLSGLRPQPATPSSQSAIANAALLGRLREVVSNNSCIVTGVSTCWHRNPEGPEAADVIEALYEALQSYVDFLEPRLMEAVDAGYPNEPHVERLERAKAALAKARGEQP